MKVLITGGTGTLGSRLVKAAVKSDHSVRILSRQSMPKNKNQKVEWAQADIATGKGLPEALHGINTIVHAATNPGFGAKKVDVEGTRRLINSSQENGIEHFIYPSIVGVSDIPYSYYQYKLKAERIIEKSSVPHTILRATQFHGFVNQLISTAMRLPFVGLIPTNFKFQTVAASEVAKHLNSYLDESPSGHLPNFGGPKVISLNEMVRTWLNIHQKYKKIIHLPLPGKTAKSFREGKNTDPNRQIGSITWKEWVENQFS